MTGAAVKKAMIVTGGSQGIGAAISRMAAERGYAVCVNYHRNRQAAEAVVAQIEEKGGKAIAVCADVSDAEAVDRLFEETCAAFGCVDALVNNAGWTGAISRLDEADPAAMKEVLEINSLGPLLCAQQAVKRMSSKHGGQGGVIVSVTTGAVSIGSPGEFVWYAASKAAVDTMTLGLSKEVGGEGIRVNAVAPGLTDTDLHAKGGEPGRAERMAPGIPIGRAASPEEVAQAVLWLCSDEASYVNGAILRCAGGR